MQQKFRAPTRAFIVCVAAVLATVAFSAASASGASPSRIGMQVNPLVAPAGQVGQYGLFSCQVGLSSATCYDPYQMRHAYGTDSLISQGYDGTGKTIVILDAFQNPGMSTSLATYDSFYGLPAANFTQVAPDGLTPFVVGDGNMTGWAEEISLDVEWAHAIAPGAKIVLDLAKDNSDDALLSAFNYAVNNNVGDVISMSFGEAESCAPQSAWHQAFANATRKGITLFASSGDQGASQPTCDGNSWIKSASSPASDPLVTAVGGTELHAAGYCLAALHCDPASNPAFGTYLGETAWNEGPFGDFQNLFSTTEASGGGFSTIWSEPSYQEGTIHGGKQRAVPDVAYNAAIEHGVLTRLDIPGVRPGMYLFGGTSCGSPQWAALTAIADQAAGHDYGFINSALYKLGQSSYASTYNDVTTGNNSALEADASNNAVTVTGFDAGAGWDAVTGLGSPKVGGLVSGLAQVWAPGQATAAINNSKNG